MKTLRLLTLAAFAFLGLMVPLTGAHATEAATQAAPMSDPSLTDPDMMATPKDPNVKVTTTVERTTTKTYTLTKQKIGHVGGRPYPVRTETAEGGTTVETFVNSVKTDTQVLKPDPMLDKPDEALKNRKPYEYPFREYNTDEEGLKALDGKAPADVKVRYTGKLND